MKVLKTIPDHVPESIVRNFDYTKSVHFGDGAGRWDKLRSFPEIFWTPYNGGHWVLGKHSDILQMLQDSVRFSSSIMQLPPTEKPFRIPPIEYDPPEHTAYRRLLTPFFSPRKIAELTEKIAKLSSDVIDSIVENRSCEFVQEVALTVPISLFLELVNLPISDQHYLVECAEMITRGVNETKIEGYQRMFEYIEIKLEERRSKPRTDDILTAISTASDDDGREWTMSEKLGMGANVLAGGLDTVAGMMSLIMIHLAQSGEDRLTLINAPDKIGEAVEELLRRYQIINVARVLVSDADIGGRQMKAGDFVLGATPLAGLNEDDYERPLDIDFNRTKKRSLIFGAGAHMCLGQFLARLELKIFFVEWLKRIPHFHIKDGTTPKLVGGPVNSVLNLELVW